MGPADLPVRIDRVESMIIKIIFESIESIGRLPPEATTTVAQYGMPYLTVLQGGVHGRDGPTRPAGPCREIQPASGGNGSGAAHCGDWAAGCLPPSDTAARYSYVRGRQPAASGGYPASSG